MTNKPPLTPEDGEVFIIKPLKNYEPKMLGFKKERDYPTLKETKGRKR